MTYNNNSTVRLLPIFIIVFVSLIFTGCGDDNTVVSEQDVLAEVNEYLKELPEWDAYANVADTTDTSVGTMVADMSDMILCTSTPYSITQNPEDIVTFGSAPNVLYLGSLIQGDSYMGGLGSMLELPIRQREPLVIALNLFSGTNIADTVVNPDGASVQASLNALVSEAGAGHVSGNRIYYNKKETYSLSQATLKLGLSFKYMGATAKSQLDYSSTTERHTITAYYKQIMYEAFIVPPQTPAEFFSSEFTVAHLNEQIDLGNIGPDNLPVYVGKIQYGRMMMFTMSSSADIDSMKLAIEGSYSGFQSYTADVEVGLRNILQSSDITVVTIGGTQSTARSMLRDGTLDDYFATDDPLTSALPLGYTLYNLADGSIATVSETTEYDMTECNGVNAVCYLNKTEWQMAVAELAGEGKITEFLTTPENIALSNEFTTLPTPNWNMGSILTFDSSSTHYPFTFRLQAHINGYRLVYEDQETGPAFGAMDQARSISIGDVDDEENDNFMIAVPEWNNNAAVFAIGITVGDNSGESEEYIEVWGIDSFNKGFDMTPNCPGLHGFIGIVSTVPLTQLFFNEGNGGDDIFVRDFCFGVLEWTD